MNLSKTLRSLRPHAPTRDAISEGRAGLGRAHRRRACSGEELASDGLRVADPVGGIAFALVWQSLRGTVVPWVVQVDKFGEAQAVAPAIADYRPTDPQDRLASRALRRTGAGHSGRSDHRAPELAARL